MVRDSRTHVDGPDGETPEERRKRLRMLPRSAVAQEFGNRLYKLMLAKGWHQSELARRADMPRDSVSTYVRGRTMPSQVNVHKLAAALEVDPNELLPDHVESAIDNDTPEFAMNVSPHSGGLAWVRINKLVTTKTALKMAELLENDEAPNRGRNG